MRNPLRQIRQVRKIRISLAGKCQLLFGTAVVMILSAALAVPWHRIEQLTGQLNERAAGTLADHARAEHTGVFGPSSTHAHTRWGAAEEIGEAYASPRSPSNTTTGPAQARRLAQPPTTS